MKPLKTVPAGRERSTGAYFSSINELLKGRYRRDKRRCRLFLTARKIKTIFSSNGGARPPRHFAQDLRGRKKAVCPGFKTRSLTDNISLISAVGNDYGYDRSSPFR